MKIVETTFERLPRERLEIGFEGENLRATVRIDCSSVFAEYPNATPTLIVKPLFADAYPVVVDRNGTDVDWLITSEILSFSGDGEIQLVFYKDQVICKSAVSKIRVSRSLTVTGDMPDPVAQWIDDANAKLAEVDAQIVELEGMVGTATDAATRAEQSASTASTKAEQAAGSAATATEKATEATNAAGTATAKAAEAQTAAQTATEKANAAAESERIATAKAGDATTAAGTATTKAEQATEAAQTATEKARDASASATAAQASASNAAASATAASASETAAKASETAAGASATQAAQSAQTASKAAQTAAQKAEEAASSASNAATSATNAATSAETASTKAGEAAQSAQEAEETAEQLAESLEQISQNTADIAEHEQEYNALKDATLIHNTASGAIASFSDGAEMPVDEVTAQINPVQDLHGYDHPWPAGGGKNLLSIDPSIGDRQINGLTIKINRNASGDVTSVVANGTATARSYITLGVYYFKSGTILNGCPSGGAANTYSIAVDSTSIADRGNGYEITEDVPQGNLMIVIANGFVCNNLTFYPMTRLASETDATFAPYSNICPITGWDGVQIVVSPTTDAEDGQTYDITLPSEAGTVYGGSLTIAEDGSGVLTVDRAMVEYDGSSDETWGEYAMGSENYCCVAYPSGKVIGHQKSICNEFKNQNRAFAASSYGIYSDHPSLVNTYFRMPNAEVTTRAEFLTWIAEHPIQLCYELANPITYTLTASQITTLLGQNNLWHDANGEITVGYKANTKLYIDGKIAELVAQIVNS